MNSEKVLQNGRSQAVRRDPWEVCREACKELSPEFLEAISERVQPPAQWRKLRQRA